MSRKSRIAEEEKEEWAKVRYFTANIGYAPPKAKLGYLDDAVVILSDDVDGVHPLLHHAALVRRLLFGSASGPSYDRPADDSTSQIVVVVDLSPLRRAMDDSSWGSALDAEGSKREALDKVGKFKNNLCVDEWFIGSFIFVAC